MQQIKEQLRDIANTKVGENYIFSGTHTNQPLYTDKTGPQNPAITTGEISRLKSTFLMVFL